MQKKIIITLLLSSIIIVVAVGIFSLQQFTTPSPGIPGDLTATKISTTRIDLTWVKAKNADTTIIERNNITSWKRGEGTEIYNDTGEHYLDVVSQLSTFYYQAWSWNQTEHAYSSKSAATNPSAIPNQPPMFGLPNPVNGTRDTLRNFSWSISINDPEGDPFTWSIQCSNKQVTGGTTASNGTKTLLLSRLANATSYTIWVNATDPTGSGRFMRRWYTFTTISNQTTQNRPPVFGTPSPANGSTGNPLKINWSIPINDPEGNTHTWSIQCSNKQVTGGTSLTNGTKTLSLSNLASATSYKIWVNATDLTGSRHPSRRWYTFTTKTTQTNNTPPEFSTPSPTNGSMNNLLNLTWSITIKDPQGNTFLWTIQCNGQTSSATGATNGTKTRTLTGLSNATTYKVWVNATDAAGSGLFTRKWYTFTTKTNHTVNNPPVFGIPLPANGSTGNPLSLTWSIPISDLEGNTFLWTIQCNGQTSTATGASNGTKSLVLSGLSNATSYKVWVNATDAAGSGLFTRRWYTFTTQTTQTPNDPPVFGTPFPANGSTGNALSFIWSIPINDSEGNTFSWTIQCNGQTNSATNATNGTKTLILTGLSFATSYRLWVNATDLSGSGLFTRKWYTFTTKANLPPDYGASNPANRSTNNPLNIIWSIPINDPDGDLFSWTIHCSNGQTNSSTNTNNGIKFLPLSGLVYATAYTVWVNATDPTGSGLFTRRWYTFTTKANLPPIFGTSSPANSTTGNPLNLTWSIPINDPEGNTFSWTIQCSNGQITSGADATNGTKTLTLSALAYATTYKIWVNATDPTGSGRYTRQWYSFITLANLPPNPPTITGPAKAKIRVATDYNFTTIDPENDTIYYFIDWGDQTNSNWIGPYPSGAIINQSHTWSKRGTYTIKAKAKNINGNESAWATLDVAMPFSYNIPFPSFWQRFFERFPHAFPILRHLLIQ